MLGRMLSLVAALLLASASASASTPARSIVPQGELASPAKTAPRGFSLAPTTASRPIALATPQATKEKAADLLRASIGREDYLRARWMDPSTGRFTQMDPFAGDPTQPLQSHDYLYVGADPVNHADPSGLFMDLNGLMQAQSLTVARTISHAGSMATVYTRAKAAVVLAGAVIAAIAVDEIRQRRRERDIPTIWFGHADVGEAAVHYEEAILEGKKSVLNYVRPGAPDGWYRSKPECKGLTGGSTGKDCDEYPFASAREGGPRNYPGGVSLKPVNSKHNQDAGRAKLWAFLAACQIMPNAPDHKGAYKVGTTLGATEWDCGRNRR